MAFGNRHAWAATALSCGLSSASLCNAWVARLRHCVGMRAQKVSAASTSSPSNAEPHPWQALGLPQGAAVDEVRRAFRAAVRGGAHPDLGGDPEAFRQLRLAYSTALAATGLEADGGRSAEAARQAAPPPATPAVSSAHPTSLEELLRVHREQSARRAARRAAQGEAEREASGHTAHSGRVRADAPRKAGQPAHSGESSPKLRRALRVLETAPNPEAREAWFRELEMERLCQKRQPLADHSVSVPATAAAVHGPISAARSTTHTGDALVGHRMVRAGAGSIKVPIYQDPKDGAYYYISPLSRRRVTLPWS